MEAMAHRLAEERPRSFAVLVILLRDRVLAGTDLPQAARILLIEAFAIAKSSQHWKEWFEAHPIRGLNPVKHIYVRGLPCMTSAKFVDFDIHPLFFNFMHRLSATFRYFCADVIYGSILWTMEKGLLTLVFPVKLWP